MGEIKVIGLGSGRAGLITREAWELMTHAETLVLRTAIHPTVAALREAGLSFTTYDGFYEQAPDFEALYRAIAADLVRRAAAGANIVYAVPGSPLVAERTVVLLRERAAAQGVPLTILPGMSFVEVLYTRLGIDPVAGLAILDAEDVAEVELLEAVVVEALRKIIAGDVDLDAPAHVLERCERSLAHDAAGHHAPCNAHGDGRLLELLL